MIILGLNAFHADSSAALVKDGALVAAAEEERFSRIKHWAGFPAQSIAYCLQEARISLHDIDHIAINQDSGAHRLKKLAYLARHPGNLGLTFERIANRRKRASTPQLIEALYPQELLRATLHEVEHHLAHLSSAFHVSPFENAAVISVDGFGDFSSSAWGIGHDRHIDIKTRVFFPHSLGSFYQALTQYLGFPHYGDEYKVMGLAPYGSPAYLDAMRQIVRLKPDGTFALDLRYFRHHRERIPYQWENGTPIVGTIFSPLLEELLGPRRTPDSPIADRHRDIARSAQAMYEEAFLHLVRTVQKETRLTDIALAGGCAMNSVANGKIRRSTPFKRVYVQAAAGDAGGAIGAAFAVWHKLGGKRSFVMDHAYWGPEFGRDAVAELLSSRQSELAIARCVIETIEEDEALGLRTARAIADGKVVGWFQGRMEWGPRALGNRSILCDPRRADMRAILNQKIKRRESFRPFAPSILEEAVPEWFEEDDDVPFMMQVFQIREDKRAAIPAVTHVDGSGRLQTVRRRSNPKYHRLISQFAGLTGVPMVLNTSFNENEPVVCKPEEALACFLRTQMDVLVIGNVFLERADDGGARNA